MGPIGSPSLYTSEQGEERAAAAARFYNKKHLLELKRQQQAARVPYSSAAPQLTTEERAFISRSVSSPLPPTHLARAAAKPAPRAKLVGRGSWPGEAAEEVAEEEEEKEEEKAPVRRSEPVEATPRNVKEVYGKGVHGSAPLALPGTEEVGAQGAEQLPEAQAEAPRGGASGRGAALPHAWPPHKQAAASGVWPGESAPAPEERDEEKEAVPESNESEDKKGEAGGSPLDQDGGFDWPAPAGEAPAQQEGSSSSHASGQEGGEDGEGGGGAGGNPLGRVFDWPQVPRAPLHEWWLRAGFDLVINAARIFGLAQLRRERSWCESPSCGRLAIPASLSHTQSVFKVVSQKSTLPQIRQLIPYYY